MGGGNSGQVFHSTSGGQTHDQLLLSFSTNGKDSM